MTLLGGPNYTVGEVTSATVSITDPPLPVQYDGDVDGETPVRLRMLPAAVQIVVHMIYFLHMNTKSEGGWTFLALLFTLTLVVITLAGSIWVMYHMDQNMMPMSPHEALQKP